MMFIYVGEPTWNNNTQKVLLIKSIKPEVWKKFVYSTK